MLVLQGKLCQSRSKSPNPRVFSSVQWQSAPLYQFPQPGSRRLILEPTASVGQLKQRGLIDHNANKPLQQYSQTIQISGQTACRVANTVNNALIRYGNSEQSVNSMELNERAIEMLLRLGEAAIANAD